ncbi:MAG: Choline-sulfatase [candidate division BRC1 bacterium ADurb.BinA364]|nr:MAG: Choline-sulfatase [candidate division BRC1 bacterium ADurb.BinA364]
MHLGTGDRGAAFNPWRGIDNDEITIAERLAERKIPTMMINDVANSVTKGKNFYKGFECYRVNRGQEGDFWWSDYSVPLEWPCEPELIRYPARRWHQILMNNSRRKTEDDWIAPGTFKMACEWIEANYKLDDFMLWVETFDPHEPWDPPQWYVDLYDPHYTGRIIAGPTYGFYREFGVTDREVEHMHARYCAEVTMVDAAIGRLLRTLAKVGLLDDVAIVFTSDHGAYFGLEGDGGAICKPHCVDQRGMLNGGAGSPVPPWRYFPLRTGTMRIPLMLKMPRQTKAQRIARIAQPWDITPTVLDLFGMPSPPEFSGESLLPVIEGKKLAPRLAGFNGASHGNTLIRQAINREWIYSVWTDGVREPSLIDLKNDPSQEGNAAREHPQVCAKLHKALHRFEPRIPSWKETQRDWF